MSAPLCWLTKNNDNGDEDKAEAAIKTSDNGEDGDVPDGAGGDNGSDGSDGANVGTDDNKCLGNRRIWNVLRCRAELHLIRALSEIIEVSG